MGTDEGGEKSANKKFLKKILLLITDFWAKKNFYNFRGFIPLFGIMKIGIDFMISCDVLKSELNEQEQLEQIDKLKEHTINILNNLEKEYKDKKYILVGSIGVIHYNSVRLHAHIRHLVNWTGKIVDGWNDKINRDVLKRFRLDGYRTKTTVYTEYDALYSESNLWSYGLKEISEGIIPLREYFYNMTDESLEYYREIGNKLYVASQKERKRNEERKERNLSVIQEIFNYIDIILEHEDNRQQWQELERVNPQRLLIEVKGAIWLYYKTKWRETGQYPTIKSTNIKDMALTYLITNFDVNPITMAQIS